MIPGLRRVLRLCATALALAVSSVTQLAAGDSPPAAPTTPPAASVAPTVAAAPASAEPATPLMLRPTKALELAPEPEHSGTGWKLVALLAILGGAAFYVRKRWPSVTPAAGELLIVRRATVGLRSELLVVNVEGQRLLLGVTPHSIQSLAILDSADASVTGPSEAFSVGARVDALLGSAEERRPVRLDRQPAARPARELDGEDLGQARGLLALRRKG